GHRHGLGAGGEQPRPVVPRIISDTLDNRVKVGKADREREGDVSGLAVWSVGNGCRGETGQVDSRLSGGVFPVLLGHFEGVDRPAEVLRKLARRRRKWVLDYA